MRRLPKNRATAGIGVVAAALLLLQLRMPGELAAVAVVLVLVLLALVYYSISRAPAEQSQPPEIELPDIDGDEYWRMAEALRESEERYRALVENLPLSIYEIGADGRLLSINQSGRQMIGTLNEAADRPYLEIIPESNRALMASLLARAAAGEALEIEYSGLGDQRQRRFVTSLIPLADSDGTLRRIMGMTQDITERRQIELDAEMERYRLDAVLEFLQRRYRDGRSRRPAGAGQPGVQQFLRPAGRGYDRPGWRGGLLSAGRPA